MIPSHSRSILLVGSGAIADRCHALLRSIGADVSRGAVDSLAALSRHECVLLATAEPRPAWSRSVDAACWPDGVPWLSVHLFAHRFRVGPIIIPRLTPCYACVNARIRALTLDVDAADASDRYASAAGLEPWFRGEFDALTEQAAAIACAETAQLISREHPTLAGARTFFWSGDMFGSCLRRHWVARVGRCSRCCAQQPNATWERLDSVFGEIRSPIGSSDDAAHD